jgi:DNA-binding NarL/FixJ family response regulator
VLPELRTVQPTTRIVVLSGFTGPEVVERVHALGADGHLPKGTPVAEIIEAVTGGLPVPGAGG